MSSLFVCLSISSLAYLFYHREKEDAHFTPHKKDKNRVLLWHGSRYSLLFLLSLFSLTPYYPCRLTNFVGIISQGLRIAPPEAPVTGYMFGKGGMLFFSFFFHTRFHSLINISVLRWYGHEKANLFLLFLLILAYVLLLQRKLLPHLRKE